MKRTVQMKNAGVPSAGMKEANFKGWKKKHWRETKYLAGFNDDDTPIIKYAKAPIYDPHPVRTARLKAEELARSNNEAA